MRACYRIADRVTEICSLYPDVHTYCRDYLCDGEPDFTVTTAQTDIDYERERNNRIARAEGRSPVEASEGYLEELAVYRKIAENMLRYDTFLIHGSCVAADGEGYLFTAKSGTGKSTHTWLWREYLGSRAVMVNDDKPLVRADADGVTIFGTPYNGKHRLGENIAVPLKAVCILERSQDNRIAQITKSEAFPMLLQQIYRPSDPVLMKKTLALADRLADSVKLYRLGCNMEIEAAKAAFDGMK